MKKHRFIVYVMAVILFAASILPFYTRPVQAVTASDWRAGRIIDDSVFTDPGGMSVSDIQSFLSSKVPTCDSYGQKTVSYYFNASTGQPKFSWISGGSWVTTTRAVFSQRYSSYYQTSVSNLPFTCLKDYYEVPKIAPGPGLPASNAFGGSVPVGAVSAAQMIYNASAKYNINPKVLLVKLHTESAGPLTTDDWPFQNQYLYAMGAHCPDSGPGGSANCDSNYAGFSIQMDEAAALLRWYLDSMTQPWWQYKKPYQTNSVLWNVSPSGCGAGDVYIETKATAALYTYTPYQPNAAALANMYSTGDGCSAYGNRNFWRVWNDWFGSTLTNGPINSLTVRMTSVPTMTPAQPLPLQPVTYSFKAKNFGATTVLLQTTLLQCRRYVTLNCDSPYAGPSSLAPGQESTFTYTLSPMEHGTYYATPLFMTGGVWYRFGTEVNASNSASYQVPGMKIMSNLSLSPGTISAGNSPLYSFIVKNIEPRNLIIQTTIIQCRYSDGTVCDTGLGGTVTLVPGQEMQFAYRLPTLAPGDIHLVPYFMIDSTWYTYFPSPSGQTSQDSYISGLRLTSPVASNIPQPLPGQSFTMNYSLINSGPKSESVQDGILQCRFNTYTNCDPSYNGPLILAPGESHQYSVPFMFYDPGQFTFNPYVFQNNDWRLLRVTPEVIGSMNLSLPAYVADTRLVSPITASPSQPLPGQSVTFSYTVKNFGDKPAIYQDSILQCRLNTFTNCDQGYTGAITINPGEQRAFTMTIPNVQAGTYTLKPYYMQNGIWYLQKPDPSGSGSLVLSVPAYVADTRLVSPITASPSQPLPGQSVTFSYTVKNFGDKPAIYQDSILQCRLNTFTNCDQSYTGAVTINPGDQRTFTMTIPSVQAGTYTLKPYYMQNGLWYLQKPDPSGSGALVLNVR